MFQRSLSKLSRKPPHYNSQYRKDIQFRLSEMIEVREDLKAQRKENSYHITPTKLSYLLTCHYRRENTFS